MKHQEAIAYQRLANMKKGIEQADWYIGRLHPLLSAEEPNLKEIETEIEEIQCFLQWVREQ